MLQRSQFKSGALAVVAVAGIFAAAPRARAQSQGDIEKQVTRMNKKAMEDYDSLEFESSRKTLIDAVAILRANGYDETPLAAKTYMNLGMVYIAGFKDRNRGVQQFVNALKIKADAKLDAALATPELDEAFGAAQKQVGVKGATTKPPEEPNKPPQQPDRPPRLPDASEIPPVGNEPIKGLQHIPVDESRPNTPIPVRAQLGTDVGATRVFLFFRAGGQEDYISSPMKLSGNDWIGVIPAEAVTGRALQYYLEARDARGRPVVGSGSAPNPYIITISDTAAAPTGIPVDIDIEDPLARDRERKKHEAEEKKKNKLDRFFFFVMPGFGFGFEPAGNHTEVAYEFLNGQYQPQTIDSAGAAIAPFHLAVEIGGMITRHFSLSLVGRFQFVTGANAETQNAANSQNPTQKASGAISGFVRARYRFLNGKFHPYVHLQLGGGQIRHALDLSAADQGSNPLVDSYTAGAYNTATDTSMPSRAMIQANAQTVCPSMNNCVDSIALGYVFIGGGGGIWYDVAPHFALIFDVTLLGAIGVGDSQSGMNIDIQAGVGAHF